jgi:dynein heavy chain
VPLDALNYLTVECNYGGRVTEAMDRRLNTFVLEKFYCPEIYEDDDYKFSESGLYFAPKHCEYEGYLAYVDSLPQFPDPEVYGFHDNAAIAKNMNEVNNCLDTMLATQQSAGGGGGGGGDALINQLADGILAKLPDDFDVAAASQRFPVEYTQSMNTVLTQELDRFNTLTSGLRKSLKDMKLAIKGVVLMSAELEAAVVNLKVGKVPEMWLAKSYPSLKGLGSYMADLYERLQWFADWVEAGEMPGIMWINRFYFTQGFLTGAKQNYARKYGIAIDLLDYDFIVVKDEENAAPPEDGVHVLGMYFEGARWNAQTFSLDESEPRILFTKVPMIWFKPCKPEDYVKIPQYLCPIYKTSVRFGTLATTGHSTNHVLNLRVPSNKPEEHWTLRGVAILLYLDD